MRESARKSKKLANKSKFSAKKKTKKKKEEKFIEKDF